LLRIKYLFSGGTFALCALLTGKSSDLNGRYKSIVNIVSILGASLLIGKNLFVNKIVSKCCLI